jgi:hypothetical protein
MSYSSAPPPPPPPPAPDDQADPGSQLLSLELGSPFKLDLGQLTSDVMSPAGGIMRSGDLLHLDLEGSKVEVGNPLGQDCPDAEMADPLISISTGFFAGTPGEGDAGGAFLGSLLAPGAGAIGTATGLAAGLLSTSGADDTGTGGSDDCACGGLLHLGNLLDDVGGVLG